MIRVWQENIKQCFEHHAEKAEQQNTPLTEALGSNSEFVLSRSSLMPTTDKREEGPRSISASLEPTTLDGGSGACLGAGTQLFSNVYADVWSEIGIIFP